MIRVLVVLLIFVVGGCTATTNQPTPSGLDGPAGATDGFRLEFSGVDYSLRTPQIGTDETVSVDGEATGCQADDGSWEFGGEITLTYSAFPENGGDLVPVSPLDTPDDVTLHFPNADSYVDILDALGDPEAEFSLVNGLGETVGPFPLEVVPTDPEC